MNTNFEALDSGAVTSDLSLSLESVRHLRTAGKWGRFISIVGIVLIAIGLFFILLGAVFSGGMGIGSLLGDAGGMSAGFGAGLMAVYFLIYAALLGVGLYMYILLYRFSTNAIRVADVGDQQAIAPAFAALAKMMTIGGVIFVIYLSFIGLFLIFGLIGGVASAF